MRPVLLAGFLLIGACSGAGLLTACLTGCCSPCKRSSAGAPDASTPDASPDGPALGASSGSSSPEEPPYPWPVDVHPRYPQRRAYIAPRVHLLSQGARVEQVEYPGALFDKLPTDGPASGLQDGLVVCRIHVSGSFDEFRAPDVSVDVRVGELLRYHFHGPEDERDMYLSIPRTTWAAGDALTFDAVDRDVFTNETIGRQSESFSGRFPLRLSHKDFTTECRAWTAEQVEAAAGKQSKAARDAAASARSRLRPNPNAAGWGYDATGLPAAWASWDQLAALIGADDPRAKSQGAELDGIEGEWGAVATRSVQAELARRAPPDGQKATRLDKLAVKVDGVVCDRARLQELASKSGASPLLRHGPMACYVQVDIERLTGPDDAFSFAGKLELNASLVGPDGADVPTEVLQVQAQGAAEPDGWPKERGEHAKVLFVPKRDVAIGRHAGTAPANAGGAVHLIRFPRPSDRTGTALFRID